MYALTAADEAAVNTLLVIPPYLQDKCVTGVFSNDIFLSDLKSLAYKYLLPKLEKPLVTATSLILR